MLITLQPHGSVGDSVGENQDGINGPCPNHFRHVAQGLILGRVVHFCYCTAHLLGRPDGWMDDGSHPADDMESKRDESPKFDESVSK